MIEQNICICGHFRGQHKKLSDKCSICICQSYRQTGHKMNNKSQNIKTNRKDVAGLVQNVLNNNVDLPDLVASLHRSRTRLEKNANLYRETLEEVLDSNLLLSKAVVSMAERIVVLEQKLGII